MNINEMFQKQTAEELIRQRIEDGFLYALENGRQYIVRDGIKSMVHRLSWGDVYKAGKCGIKTRTHSREKNYKCKLSPIQQRPENIWSIEVEPRCAELAVARFLDLPWHCHVDKFNHGGDVGEWTQVRHSFDNDNGLKHRESNSVNKPYVQVSGGNGWFLIHGWEWGWKCRHRPTTFPVNPCWIVPLKDLRPMDEFPPEPDFKIGKDITDERLCEFMGWTPEQWQDMTRYDGTPL